MFVSIFTNINDEVNLGIERNNSLVKVLWHQLDIIDATLQSSCYLSSIEPNERTVSPSGVEAAYPRIANSK
jgi:hypothetical protein